MNRPEGPVPPNRVGGEEGPLAASPRALPEPASLPEEPPATLFLFGIPFHDVTLEETLAWIAARARAGRPAQLVTSNLDFILQAWRDPEMHRIHLEADLVVADGWPPVLLSRFFGPRLRERVAGSDLVPLLGPLARDRGLSLYGLGGKPGVGAEALRILQERSPGLRVAGCGSPPISSLLEMDHEGLRREIVNAKPDILLVAFGAPKQDKWIRMNALSIGVPVSMGVGGSLDFIAGAQTRAPRWIQKIGLEWFWRLARQPRRLFRRYSSNLLFLVMILSRLLLLRLSPAGRNAGAAAPDPATLAARGLAILTLPPLTNAAAAGAFCRLHEPVARQQSIVLDLSGFSWLNSLELGVLARLARSARRAGRSLFLSGSSLRVSRLIRLLRLERYVEVPSSADAWARRLEELLALPEDRKTRWIPEAGVLRIVLPEQFEGDEAWRVGEEFVRRASETGIHQVLIDGGRLRYIDSSGLQFLGNVRRWLDRKPGGAMSLRSFPEAALDALQREGLDSIPVETPVSV